MKDKQMKNMGMFNGASIRSDYKCLFDGLSFSPHAFFFFFLSIQMTDVRSLTKHISLFTANSWMYILKTVLILICQICVPRHRTLRSQCLHGVLLQQVVQFKIVSLWCSRSIHCEPVGSRAFSGIFFSVIRPVKLVFV